MRLGNGLTPLVGYDYCTEHLDDPACGFVTMPQIPPGGFPDEREASCQCIQAPCNCDDLPEYTLPVEVIHTGYPIPVGRPEPVYEPVPGELEYPAEIPVQQASMGSWLVLTLLGGFLISSMSKPARRKT